LQESEPWVMFSSGMLAKRYQTLKNME